MISTSKNIWGFDPRSVGSCVLWLDAADNNTLTLSGSNVTTWSNKSGSSNNAVASTGTVTTNSTPINGLNTIRFAATSFLNISSFTMTSNISAFVVFRGVTTHGTGPSGYFFLGNGTAPSFFQYTLNDSNYGSFSGLVGSLGETNWTLPSSNFFFNNPGILYVDNRTSYASGNQLRLNSIRNPVPNLIPAGTYSVQVGGRAGDSVAMDFAELIFYNSSITESQRQQVEGYLGWKWGIQSSIPSVSYVAPLSTVGFTPRSISNCVLWNDASTLTGSGAVGTWTNPQGGYTVSCTGTKTAAGRNGLNTVSLTTAQTWIPSPEVSLNAYTLFWSGRKTSTTGGRVLQGAGNNQLYGYWSTVEKVIYIDGNPNVLTGPTVDSAWDTFSHARIASGAFVFNWNGVLHYSNATSGSVGMNGLRINSGASPSETSACEIGEIILYNRSLTRTEISTVDAYLMNKWGISNAGVPTFNIANPYFYIKPHLRAFQPNTIQGCTLWLDAADSSTITLSSGNMTQWRDKSGFGNNMTYFSTFSNATVSTAFQNGLNVLNFSGNGLYRSPASSAVYPLDGYFVLALKDTTTRVDVFGMGATAIDNFNSLTFGEYITSRWHNGSTGFSRTPNCVAPSNETSTSFLLIQWSIANNNFLLRRNGTLLVQTASYTFTLTAGSIFQIGLRYPHYSTGALTELFRGYLGEIVMFNRQLGDGERQQIEGYLAWKWGIRDSLTVFLPISITGCAMWLDANDPNGTGVRPNAGTTISTWVDKSGNSNNGTSGNATLEVDSLGGFINFTGSQSYVVTNPNIVVNQYFTVFVVETLQNYSGNDTAFMGGTGTNNNNLHLVYRGGQIAFSFYGADLTATPSFVFSNNASQPTRVWSFSFIANFRGIYLNGVLLSSNTSNVQLTGWAGARIGFYYDGRNYTGKMREILIYSGTINTNQRQQVEGYLAQKWGIGSFSIQPIHPFKTFPPASIASRSISSFSPRSISGLLLWLDAVDPAGTGVVPANGGRLSTWVDKSGNGYNFTQASISTSLPSISYNTNGIGVYFGSLQGLNNTTLPFPTSYTIFAVANQLTNSGAYQYILHSPHNADFIVFFGSLGGNFATFAGSATAWNDVTANSPTSPIATTSSTSSLLCCTNNGTTLTPYFNSVAMTTKNGTNASTTGMIIGSTFSASSPQPWLGTIYEIVVYNSVLTTDQRQQIEGYLAWKWKIPITDLIPSHPFKQFPPTTQVELTATGGTVVVTRDYTTYHVFTSSSNFVVVGSGRVNYLFVGGGGGGGDRHGGGGGAGGVQSGSFSVTTGTYAVTVGQGGAGGNYEDNNSSPRGSGLRGGDTTISGVNTGLGGGGGGTYDGPSSGTFGSGGGGGGGAGSGNSPAPSAGTAGQGNSGGTGSNPGGGGGGGAGGAGVNADASAGGIGTAAYSVHLLAVGYGSSFAIPTGTNQVISEGVAYIAGGGGGANGFGARPPYAYGGLGGGGRGDWDNSFISAGTPNTGGGGGASRSESGGGSAGFPGGSGLVLLWY